MTALLELVEVTKTFGGILANDKVSLSVPQGSVVGLIGPNGSGKTTLFDAITGVVPIDSGSIRFKGEEISKRLTGRIARAGIVRTFQQPRLYPGMTVAANMLISVAIRRSSFTELFGSPPPGSNKKILELLDFVDLSPKRATRAGALSFGQQKLLELAMALANDPDLLLLDEPTAGINPVLIESLIDRLKAANRELGLTLLVIEHNMPVIMDLAERIYCLAHGRLLAEGRPQDIKRNPKVLDAYLGAL